MSYFIYTLSDPETEEIRYVGITYNLAYRLRKHLVDKTKTWKNHWIQKLKTEGKVPLITVLCEVRDLKEACIEECNYIKLLRILGYNLTNHAEGGNIPPNHQGKKRSKEVKEKMKKAITTAWHKKIKQKDYIPQTLGRKTIHQFTKEGKYIQSWEGVNLAARELGLHSGNISATLKGRVKSTGGFIWKYEI